MNDILVSETMADLDKVKKNGEPGRIYRDLPTDIVDNRF
jgi:hypothetical protein